SPGILTGEFLYVSGQGAKNTEGRIPPGLEQQLRQCFENVKTIAEAAGLSMEHVVYTQVYLTDATDEGPAECGVETILPQIASRTLDDRSSAASRNARRDERGGDSRPFKEEADRAARLPFQFADLTRSHGR